MTPAQRDPSVQAHRTPDEWFAATSSPTEAAELAAACILQAIEENKSFCTATFDRLFGCLHPVHKSMTQRWRRNDASGLTELVPEDELRHVPVWRVDQATYLRHSTPLGGYGFRCKGVRNITKKEAIATHRHACTLALKERSSVLVANVRKYRLALPDGYVKNGDLYTYLHE